MPETTPETLAPDKPITIRVGTCNLFEGGLAEGDHDGEDDFDWRGLDYSRLRKQAELLSRLNLDVIGIQEATWGVHSHDLMNWVADTLGTPWCSVGPSNFYECDLAAFVRVTDHLTVDKVTHLTGPPFVHGLINVKLRIAGRRRPVHFLIGHSAPSSPGMRLLETEMVTVHRHLDVIYVADHNAAALDDDPDTTGLNPYKVAKKLDTRPAEELEAAGFHDVGRVCKDPTPTVGHGTPNQDGSGDKLAYRCDRIYTTLPTECITGYGVETEGDEWSDHRIVWAELAIGG